MATKLNIRFGLMVLPIALDAGARADRVSMKMLAPDGGGVKQKLVSEKTGEEVLRTTVRKGAEAAPGVLVEIPAAEIEALEPKSARVVDITEFVPGNSIDPIWFESSHYLKPQPGTEEAFALLYNALKTRERMAIGKAFLDGSEHIVAIRAAKSGLVLFKLFFHNEVRGEREYRPDVASLDPKKVEMAGMLVDAMSAPGFDASRFEDTYTQNLRALIAGKIAAVDPAAAVPMAAPAPDIMITMMASLKALGAPVAIAKPVRHGRAVKRRAASSASSAEVLGVQPVVSLLDQIVEAHQECAA